MVLLPRTPRALTEKQLRVLQVIYTLFQEHGHYPTQLQIVAALKTAHSVSISLSYLKHVIAAIEKKGYLTRDSSVYRGNIRLTEHALARMGEAPPPESANIVQGSLHLEETRRRA